jgi:hypothetical protein
MISCRSRPDATTMKLSRFLFAVMTVGCVGLFAGLTPARAQTATGQFLYHVTIDLSQLADHPAGPFSLEFTLVDGAGIGNSDSSITVSNFNFGAGGVPGGEPDTSGGVGGDLSSQVLMFDFEPDNGFTEAFTPAGTVTFDLVASLSLETNGVSDVFSFAIVDADGERIPSLDAEAEDALIRLTTGDGVSISVETYTTDATVEPLASGPPVSFGPSVRLDGTVEPGAPLLVIGGGTNGTATLSWPLLFSDFSLETTGDFTNWDFVAAEPEVAGTNYAVTVSTGGLPAEYFRLRK